MLQVDSDSSFLLLFADSTNASTDKSTAAMSMSNHWQAPPVWQHHHRQPPPPSSAPFALLSPRALGHGRHANSTPSPDSHHDQHRQYHDQRDHGYEAHGAGFQQSFRAELSHGAYEHEHDQRSEGFYPPQSSSSSSWSYPGESHHHHHHVHPSHAPQHYGKSAHEMGIAIDPLPLRHLGAQPLVANNGVVNVDDELYEAHMLQEALTAPQYPRAHPAAPYHHHHHHHHAPQYQSSQFVSAVLEASAPMHHHHHHSMIPPPSMYPIRPSSANASEHHGPSDSDATSEATTAPGVTTATGKRKRRGESAPRLCRVEGCNKGIRSRGLCKAHGGGRRCMTPGCTTSDQGGGHCVLHGGGRRCTVEGCTKSAQWKGLCKMHGGARRCRYPNCTKNGQVKQGYCRAHHNLISKQREQEEARAQAMQQLPPPIQRLTA